VTEIGVLPTLTPEAQRNMLRQMIEIRSFEHKVIELFREGLVRGATHTYVGEEAVAVGACAALRPDDFITSTHRGHGHCIAKGGDLRLMMAELLGRTTGYCKGKGGSMHIADLDKGILGANGIVAGGVGVATGAALACKMRHTDQVVVCFFGDGAINQGILYECANFAAVWRLPVIYVCENNQYAMSTGREPTRCPTSRRAARRSESRARRLTGWIPTPSTKRSPTRSRGRAPARGRRSSSR
jgi:TPP-dependent pyruvate/acetoin dehydrogenase alpha subunit